MRSSLYTQRMLPAVSRCMHIYIYTYLLVHEQMFTEVEEIYALIYNIDNNKNLGRCILRSGILEGFKLRFTVRVPESNNRLCRNLNVET